MSKAIIESMKAKQHITDSIIFIIEGRPTASGEYIADTLNRKGITTLKGEVWKSANVRRWVDVYQIDYATLTRNKERACRVTSVNKLTKLIKLGRLYRDGVFGDCMKRAQDTIRNLEGLGV